MKPLPILALAAGLALSTVGTAIAMTDEETMSMGYSMLVGSIHSALVSNGFSTEDIDRLTLNEVVQLREIMFSGEGMSGDVKSRINLLLQRAQQR